RRPVEIRISAADGYPTNLEPSADPEPVGGDLDRRQLGPFPEGLDAAWTSLDEPPVAFRWPQPRIDATLTTQPRASYIVSAGAAAPRRGAWAGSRCMADAPHEEGARRVDGPLDMLRGARAVDSDVDGDERSARLFLHERVRSLDDVRNGERPA